MGLSRRDKTAVWRIALNTGVTAACSGIATWVSIHPRFYSYVLAPFALLFGWAVLWEALDRRGDRSLTMLLHSLYVRIDAPHDAKLRLTLFEPSGRHRALHQVARYRWDGSTKVGGTIARWDAGPIGKAMQDQSSIVIEDVDSTQGGGSGSFEATLRAYGMTSAEVEALELKDRKCYAAVSVYDRGTKQPVAGILIDAAQPRSAGRDAIVLAQSYAETIIYVLKGGGR